MESKRYAMRFGFAYLALATVMLVVQYGAVFLVDRFLPALAAFDGYTWLVSLAPLYAAAMPVCLALLPARSSEQYAQTALPFKHWLAALMAVFGLGYIGNLIASILMLTVSLLRGEAIVNPVQAAILESNPLWSALAAVVVAPIGEEILFRRLILDRTRRYGERTALLLSAVMFGAFHMNLYQFFYAFLIGLVLGYLYLRTGRLRYSIALHAAFNFVGSVISPAILRRLTPLLNDITAGEIPSLGELFSAFPALSAIFGLALLQVGCAIATVLLALVFRRRLMLAPGESPQPLWRSPTLIAFLSLCAAMAIVSMR